MVELTEEEAALIRRKIEANPEKPEAIRTVRGIGYVYDPK